MQPAIRRLPITQNRFKEISATELYYQGKDSRQKLPLTMRFSIQEFIAVLAEHVPDRYSHSIRYFGLLAPRSPASIDAVFVCYVNGSVLRHNG